MHDSDSRGSRRTGWTFEANTGLRQSPSRCSKVGQSVSSKTTLTLEIRTDRERQGSKRLCRRGHSEKIEQHMMGESYVFGVDASARLEKMLVEEWDGHSNVDRIRTSHHFAGNTMPLIQACPLNLPTQHATSQSSSTRARKRHIATSSRL